MEYKPCCQAFSLLAITIVAIAGFALVYSDDKYGFRAENCGSKPCETGVLPATWIKKDRGPTGMWGFFVLLSTSAYISICTIGLYKKRTEETEFNRKLTIKEAFLGVKFHIEFMWFLAIPHLIIAIVVGIWEIMVSKQHDNSDGMMVLGIITIVLPFVCILAFSQEKVVDGVRKCCGD